ncbi:MAG: hypothetical protein R2725_13100 [Solirubrobacterales bacterium]
MLSESFGVLQAALLGVVGLILAFGLSLSLSRYEDRRDAIVTETNAIGTSYLRAQTLPEPLRTRSLDLLAEYTASAREISEYPPDSAEEKVVSAREDVLQNRLWALAAAALDAEPVASAPRLYAQSLNEAIDAQVSRTAALHNQVPTAVLVLELVGASFALGLLAAYLALVGRGLAGVLLAALLVVLLLFVTADLDRPTRGPIEIPDTPLAELHEQMQGPPAVPAPPR